MQLISTKATVKEDIKSLLMDVIELRLTGSTKFDITSTITTWVKINLAVINEAFIDKSCEKDLVPFKKLVSIRDLSKYIGEVCQELEMEPYYFDMVLETFLSICYNQCTTMMIGYPIAFVQPDEKHIRLHNDRPGRPIEEVFFQIRTTYDTITLYHGNMLIGYIHNEANSATAIYMNDTVYLGSEYLPNAERFISHCAIVDKKVSYPCCISKIERTINALKWLIWNYKKNF